MYIELEFYSYTWIVYIVCVWFDMGEWTDDNEVTRKIKFHSFQLDNVLLLEMCAGHRTHADYLNYQLSVSSLSRIVNCIQVQMSKTGSCFLVPPGTHYCCVDRGNRN